MKDQSTHGYKLALSIAAVLLTLVVTCTIKDNREKAIQTRLTDSVNRAKADTVAYPFEMHSEIPAMH